MTGLIWLQEANCLMGSTDWKSANEFAVGLADGECGLSDRSKPGDWRLPTKDEWEATIARAKATGCTSRGTKNPPSLTNRAGTDCFSTDANPAFSGVQTILYWSSSAFEPFPSGAWTGDLDNGITQDDPKFFSSSSLVWPVR